MVFFYIIATLLLIFILWSILEQRLLVRSEYIIHSDKLGEDIKELSFTVLADLHGKGFGHNNKRLLKKLLEAKPDFIIIAGDMITKRKLCYPGKTYNLIKEISEHFPIYYAYGNHEQYFEDLAQTANDESNKKNNAMYESWCVYKIRLKQLGVHLLDNSSIVLQYNKSKVSITGLSLPAQFYDRRNKSELKQNILTSIIGNRDKEGYQLLIAHNPIYFADYIKWGADLVISGHVHGGLIRLPFIGGIISPQVKLFPKYDAGQYCEKDSYMVVSRGLGSHSFMPRFLNPPELVNIRLINRKEEL